MSMYPYLSLKYGILYSENDDFTLSSLNSDFGNENNNPEDMLNPENWDTVAFTRKFPHLTLDITYPDEYTSILCVQAQYETSLMEGRSPTYGIFPLSIPDEEYVIPAEVLYELQQFAMRYPSKTKPHWFITGEES